MPTEDAPSSAEDSGSPAGKPDSPVSDGQRYLEYLQKQLMPEGWASRFESRDEARQIAESTRWKEDPSWAGSGEGNVLLLEFISGYKPQTRFDSAVTQSIFRPILDDLLAEANSRSWRKLDAVQLLSSTDPGPTPVARPSSTGHMLFIGEGTMSYCNFWAKVFAPVVARLFVKEQSFRVRSDAEIRTAAKGKTDSIDLAGALCIYFAAFRTTIGFGRLTSLPQHAKYRTELLTAMERFIVAHELSHFIAFQEIPGADGVMDRKAEKAIELFCDDVGLALSRAVAADKNCPLGRSGVAAMLFFRTIAWADELRTKMGLLDQDSGSHPSCEERIELIRSRVIQFDEDKDGLLEMLCFYEGVFTSIKSIATRRIDAFVSVAKLKLSSDSGPAS